jgi:hypothetical protein
MTKRELALLAEWFYLKGELRSEKDLIALSWRVFQVLSSQPQKSTSLTLKQATRGVGAIYSDLLPVWRVLSYGQQNLKSPLAQMRQPLLAKSLVDGQFSALVA